MKKKTLYVLAIFLLSIATVNAAVTTELQTEFAPCPWDADKEIAYYTSWYTVEENDPALSENTVVNTFQVDVQGTIRSGESAILPDEWYADATINGVGIPGGYGGFPYYNTDYYEPLKNGVNTISVRSIKDLSRVYPDTTSRIVDKNVGDELWSSAIVVCMPHDELIALGAINPNYPELPVEVPEFGTVTTLIALTITCGLVVAVRRN